MMPKKPPLNSHYLITEQNGCLQITISRRSHLPQLLFLGCATAFTGWLSFHLLVDARTPWAAKIVLLAFSAFALVSFLREVRPALLGRTWRFDREHDQVTDSGRVICRVSDIASVTLKSLPAKMDNLSLQLTLHSGTTKTLDQAFGIFGQDLPQAVRQEMQNAAKCIGYGVHSRS